MHTTRLWTSSVFSRRPCARPGYRRSQARRSPRCPRSADAVCSPDRPRRATTLAPLRGPLCARSLEIVHRRRIDSPFSATGFQRLDPQLDLGEGPVVVVLLIAALPSQQSLNLSAGPRAWPEHVRPPGRAHAGPAEKDGLDAAEAYSQLHAARDGGHRPGQRPSGALIRIRHRPYWGVSYLELWLSPRPLPLAPPRPRSERPWTPPTAAARRQLARPGIAEADPCRPPRRRTEARSGSVAGRSPTSSSTPRSAAPWRG